MFRQGSGSQGEVGLPSPRCEANEKRGPGRPGGPPNKKAILQGPPSGAEGFLEISQGPPETRPGTVFEQQSGGERRPVSLSGRSLISYRRGFRKPGTGLLSRACQQKSRQCRYAWQNDFQEPCSLETYGVAFLHVIFEGISALSGCSMGPEPIFSSFQNIRASQNPWHCLHFCWQAWAEALLPTPQHPSQSKVLFLKPLESQAKASKSENVPKSARCMRGTFTRKIGQQF